MRVGAGESPSSQRKGWRGNKNNQVVVCKDTGAENNIYKKFTTQTNIQKRLRNNLPRRGHDVFAF